jgi:hypothetical protein
MNGSTSVEGNAVSGTGNGGGGVCVFNNGTFTMNGSATVKNNAASSKGGGVYVFGGTFTMKDTSAVGTTGFGNTADKGGGVYVFYSTFTMSGGSITANTATGYGGGVYVNYIAGTLFTMSGGTISSNTADANHGKSLYLSGNADAYRATSKYGNGTLIITSGQFNDNNLAYP